MGPQAQFSITCVYKCIEVAMLTGPVHGEHRVHTCYTDFTQSTP